MLTAEVQNQLANSKETAMNPLFQRRLSRRTLLKQGAGLVAAPLIVPSRVLGAQGAVPPSDRVTVGFIGVGIMGRSHLRRMVNNPWAQILAVCDVDEWRLQDAQARVEAAYTSQRRGDYTGCAAYRDFRELLARPDIDAVLIATGDRWHAVQTVMAAKAGKDIYCEKPISLTIHESRAMVDAVRRYGRVFQGGFQQRSVREFRIAVDLIQRGRLGRLKTIYACVHADAIRIGTSKLLNLPAEPVPATLDWEMWVGPAVWHPFNSRYHHLGEPREVVPWWDNRDFSGGDVTCCGVHNLDVAQWALGMDASGPVEITPPPGLKTSLVTYTYANGVTVQSIAKLDPAIHDIPAGFDPATEFGYAVLFVGERGWIFAGRNGRLDAYPREMLSEIEVTVPVETGPSAAPTPPPPDARTGATTPSELAEQLYRARGYSHHDNWLHAVRMRQQPICDVETSARASDVSHLANISLWTGRPLKWNPVAEAFIDDDEANRLRQRALREPWTL
jgi:predicted dehydrogenase